MRDGDTIVALSSGAVPAGVAVIRISGPQAERVPRDILGQLPRPRALILSDITLDGERLDRGLIAWMPGPRSFTGEDCAELQLHGSPAVVRAVLRHLTARPGFRLADAGEFTRRAFENGKLDLVEAQGLGDLIVAETENQRALAYARMEGGLTRRIEGWRERLLDLRAEIEAQLDFSDESDVGTLPLEFQAKILALHAEMSAVLATRGLGRVMRDGFRVVLAGPPNAGKSSLLNALSHSDAAIVSEEAGTTRDLKEIPLDINGQLILLIDSAGIRETASAAERLGVQRAREAMLRADMVAWLNSPDQPAVPPPDFEELGDERWDRPPVVRVGTKADLGAVAGSDISVSSRSGEGVGELLQLLYDASGAGTIAPSTLLVSHERDQAALVAAAGAIGTAAGQLDRPELAGEELRSASAALERLLGRMDAEAVLDRLFSAFCIGK